jgi:hypothetical protein
MSRFKPLLKSLLKELLIFGASFLLFSVSFSFGQSLVLALVIVAGFETYANLNAKASADEYFTPFTVWITPNFGRLLLDYKILQSTDEVQQLRSLWRKKDQRLIGFTVLKLRPSGDWLLYHHQDRAFKGGMEFKEPIEAVVISNVLDHSRQKGTVYLRDPCNSDIGFAVDSPAFYFRQHGGYELGLMLDEDWWKQTCEKNPTADFAKVKGETDHRFGKTRIPVVTLPYLAFDIFRIRYDDYDGSRKYWDAIEKTLPQFGWTREGEDEGTEVHDPWIRLHSKYFEVSFKEV